jgi:hypothetical protein
MRTFVTGEFAPVADDDGVAARERGREDIVEAFARGAPEQRA